MTIQNEEFVFKLTKNNTYIGVVFWIDNDLFLRIKIKDHWSDSYCIKDYEKEYKNLKTDEISLVEVNFYDGTDEISYSEEIWNDKDILILLREHSVVELSKDETLEEFLEERVWFIIMLINL